MPTTRRCCRPPTRRVSPCSGSRSGRATARASRSPSWCPRRPTSGRSSSSTCGERWSTCGERWSSCGERSSTCVSEPSEELSYRALLSVPSYPRAVAGAPLAGVIVGVAGGEAAIITTGVIIGLGALVMIGINDPETNTSSTGNLLRDAWDGLRYVLRNPTLRGLAASISIANLANGAVYIALPVLIFQRFHQGPPVVGLLYAVSGVAGLFTTTFFGRMNSQGRERAMLAWPQMALLVPFAMIAVAPNVYVVGAALVLFGLLVGPVDIALFTIRQRRTDPAWMGRAFAVSMSLNFSGVPIGSAIAGPLVGWSIDGTLLLAGACCVVAGIMPLVVIPA